MNINAGTNQYNLSLKKMKEEKRPTFATIFDKLDARSKKLNSKNPLNAVMTNEQMFRYYLEETEPMLREAPDDYDLLDDVIGGKSLKDMKLSEFAKLLSGELESNRNVKYETLTATITPTPAAPIVPSSITITTPPSAPAPVAPAPVAPPSGSAPAPVAPPSGSAPAPVAPPSAPSGSAPAPVAPPSSAPPAGSGLSVSIPPAGSGSGSTPTGSTAGGIVSGIASAASGLLSSAKSLLSSPKPPTGGPSGTSVPSSAVASAATTAPATGVPTATPASGASSPAAAGSSPAAAAGSSLTAAEIAAASMTSAELAGHKKKEDIEAYIDGVNKGLNPPEKPASLKGAIDIEDKEWVRYTIALITHNKMADKPFSLSAKQQQIAKNYEQALATTADKSDIESIIQNTIIIAQTPKPKSGKGGKNKK